MKGTCLDGKEFTAIPYYLWNNRGKGWVRQDKKQGVSVSDQKKEDINFAAHTTKRQVQPENNKQ